MSLRKSNPPHLWCLWDQQFHIIHVLNISLPTTLPHSEQLLIVWSLYSFTLIKNGWWAKNGLLNIDTAWAAEKDVGLNEVGSHHPLTRDEHDFRKIAKKIIKKWPKNWCQRQRCPGLLKKMLVWQADNASRPLLCRQHKESHFQPSSCCCFWRWSRKTKQGRATR